MSDDLRELLITVAVCAPVGLAIGIAIRKLAPGWCKDLAKFSQNGHWWIYVFGAILFAGLAISSFAIGQPYRGAFFTAGLIFEVFAFFFYGFKRLTPEMEKKIDESDPSKLRPWRFWK